MGSEGADLEKVATGATSGRGRFLDSCEAWQPKSHPIEKYVPIYVITQTGEIQ